MLFQCSRHEDTQIYVEGVVDQVIADTSKHIQACEDIFHMVINVGLGKSSSKNTEDNYL